MEILIVRAYQTTTEIKPCRFVKFTSAGIAAQASLGTDKIVGCSDSVGQGMKTVPGGVSLSEEYDTKMPVDVVHLGVKEIKLGGHVDSGDKLTADSDGRGITATLVGGSVVYTGGIALDAGEENDIISFFVVPGILH